MGNEHALCGVSSIIELCGVYVDGGSSVEKREGHECETVAVLSCPEYKLLT